MNLFKYKDYEVVVSPEALTLKPFKRIWDRDKSKKKEQATDELAFLYFYCDIKSDYQYLTDEATRMEAVKKGLGFPDNWQPDATLKSAIELYKTFDSPAVAMLRVAFEAVEKTQQTLKDLEPDDTKSLKEYLTALKMIPEVVSMLKDAEKAILEDHETGEAKGAIEKAMFDDGLDDVADWVDNQK
jgi:hypothetical protein